jgi:hypothetical protein
MVTGSAWQTLPLHPAKSKRTIISTDLSNERIGSADSHVPEMDPLLKSAHSAEKFTLTQGNQPLL